MSKKNILNVKIDSKEPQNNDVPQVREKAEFEALIEAYKARNPVKYALKKAELEAKLAKL